MSSVKAKQTKAEEVVGAVGYDGKEWRAAEGVLSDDEAKYLAFKKDYSYPYCGYRSAELTHAAMMVASKLMNLGFRFEYESAFVCCKNGEPTYMIRRRTKVNFEITNPDGQGLTLEVHNQ